MAPKTPKSRQKIDLKTINTKERQHDNHGGKKTWKPRLKQKKQVDVDS